MKRNFNERKGNFNEVLRSIRSLLIPYLVVLCICLIIKLIYSRQEIYFAVNGIFSPIGDFLAPFLTDLGNGWFAVAIAAVLALFNYRKAFIAATSYAVTSVAAQLLKYIFDQPRPALYFRDQLSRIHFVKDVDILKLHSFPSGHTVSAFTLAVLFTYWSKNKAWGPLFLLAALFVGYSRMYLSEHFFEDVVAGSVIGVVVTAIWLSWIDSKAFLGRSQWQRGLLR